MNTHHFQAPSPLLFASVERERNHHNLRNIATAADECASACLSVGDELAAYKWSELATIARCRLSI